MKGSIYFLIFATSLTCGGNRPNTTDEHGADQIEIFEQEIEEYDIPSLLTGIAKTLNKQINETHLSRMLSSTNPNIRTELNITIQNAANVTPFGLKDNGVIPRPTRANYDFKSLDKVSLIILSLTVLAFISSIANTCMLSKLIKRGEMTTPDYIPAQEPFLGQSTNV